MGIIDPNSRRLAPLANSRRALMLTMLLLVGVGGCSPPSMGVDKDAYKAVDALYTAVSLRDVNLVSQCETTLKGLMAEGKLPPKAADALESIIAQGKKGNWEPAQTSLASFMEGQRK